jgi:hypothetical protein
VEKVFRGEITAWSKLLNKAKLVNNGAETCGNVVLLADAPTSGALRTAFDYYNFVLADGAGGGQTLIGENTDYLGLPAAIKTIARAGIKRLSF